MIAVLAAFTILASRHHADRQPMGKQALVIEQVLLRDNQYTNGLVRKDLPGLRALLADDFVGTHENGPKRSKKQFLADVAQGPLLVSIAIENRRVRVTGPKAMVTAQYIMRGIRSGKGFVESGHSSDVWVSQQGQWYCAAAHSQSVFHGDRL